MPLVCPRPTLKESMMHVLPRCAAFRTAGTFSSMDTVQVHPDSRMTAFQPEEASGWLFRGVRYP